MTSKNEKQLLSFVEYCIAHPEQRFYQALRNWSNQRYIYASDKKLDDPDAIDTFYWEEDEQDGVQ